ncbi:MAG: hypothetical protein ACE3JP_07665 [Ectobacillus sp.]
MYKRVLATMTFFILFKAISVDPVKAETEPSQKQMQMRIEQHFRQKAERFGIETEGKNLKEVRKELHAEQEERRRAEIYKAAQQYHVATQGKSLRELIHEIRTAREQELHQKAEQAGISTEGKTMYELAEELKEKKK